MKVKIISETSEKKLERQVNAFICRPGLRIESLQFAGAGFALWPVFSVMIAYEESGT